MTAGKICLTGSSGFLGSAFLLENKSEKFWLPLRRKSSHIPHGSVMDDWENIDWEKAFKKENIKAVINTAAMADPISCEDHPVESEWINVEWPLLLGDICKRLGVPLVHFSTDLVFDGREDEYGDSSKTKPLSLYGFQKAEVEEKLMTHYSETWLCRLPLLFGESAHGTRNGWQHWVERAKGGEKQNLFIDEFRSPVRSRRVARFILDRLGELKGLMNLGGIETLSRFEMGEKVCRVFGLDPTCINPVSLQEIDFFPPRPPSLSLNSRQAMQEGLLTRPFEEELIEIKKGGGWVRQLPF